MYFRYRLASCPRHCHLRYRVKHRLYEPWWLVKEPYSFTCTKKHQRFFYTRPALESVLCCKDRKKASEIYFLKESLKRYFWFGIQIEAEVGSNLSYNERVANWHSSLEHWNMSGLCRGHSNRTEPSFNVFQSQQSETEFVDSMLSKQLRRHT